MFDITKWKRCFAAQLRNKNTDRKKICICVHNILEKVFGIKYLEVGITKKEFIWNSFLFFSVSILTSKYQILNTNTILPNIRSQNIWNKNASVFLLIIFHDGNESSADCKRRTIQRVRKNIFSLAFYTNV